MIEALLLLILAFVLIFAASGVALVLIVIRRVPQSTSQAVALPEPKRTRYLR